MTRSILSRCKRICDNSGAASIEFSVVLIPFLASLLFIMELCRIMYLTAAVDLVLAESARYISLEPSATDYSQSFNRVLNDNIALWPLLASGQPVNVSVSHCANLADLRDMVSRCTMDDADGNRALAVYSLTYHYKPLFFIFSAGKFDSLLSRKVVFIQEAKRG